MTKRDDEARRSYWIGYMDEMDLLVEKMMAYPYDECGEGLGSIPDALAGAGVEARFSQSKIDGDLDRIFFIRERLLPDLVAITREMNERGWIPLFEDGYRTQDMQTRLGRAPGTFDRIVQSCVWECRGEVPPIDLVIKRARVLIANCGKTGTHTQAAAVDISVLNRDDGSEVWRGKAYLEMSEYTPMASPFVSDEERANRYAITEVMERHGFMHFPGEFWHYNKGDMLYQILTHSGQPGIYGPVHWDRSSNCVVPYEDPLAVLNPRALLEEEVAKAMERSGGIQAQIRRSPS